MARRLPAEWEPQGAVLLTWPHAATDWAPLLERVEPVYDALTAAVTAREPAVVICAGPDHAEQVRARLARGGADPARLTLAMAPSNDTWVRDYGPITVLEGDRPLLLDFGFNGWGGKFEAQLDDRVPARLHAAGVFGDTPLATIEQVLEGGSIDSDGAGTLLTTRRCLMARAGPAASARQVEASLAEHLGAERVLWLEHGGLEGDDTDGHVDTLARFCGPATIAYVRCADPRDRHYRELAAMETELRALRTREGRPYRLVPLPLPAARRGPDGARLPATYANFLIVNGAVLVPTYDDPADAQALQALAAAFRGRSVVPVPSLPLTLQHGSLHCATMQVPRQVFRP
jgi:agmatine/peptidylarginine deiminase